MQYIPKRRADENQSQALKLMRGREIFALRMGMRTRKTKVILDDFGEMEIKGKVRDLLVIAPGGVYKTWATAIDLDWSEDLRRRAAVLVWQSYRTNKWKKEAEAFLRHEGPRALIVNVEALSEKKSPGQVFVGEFLQQRPKKTYAVVDESVCIKNRSKRTRYVLKSIKPLSAKRRILSGLMTPQSPIDVYYQFEFLDKKIIGDPTWDAFRSRIAYTKMLNAMPNQINVGPPVEIIDKSQGDNGFRPEEVADVMEKIDAYSFRVPFNPLVPSTYSTWEVTLTPEQLKAYGDMKKFSTALINEKAHVTATVVVAQMMKLHQILLGHVIDEDGNEQHFKENRSTELLKLLDDYGGKAVIWCSYDPDIRKLTNLLREGYGEETVARFWGGNVNTREEEERLFKTDPRCRFMLATPDAGGKGRTWDVADLAVFYSSRDNLDHREQAEQRTLDRDKTRGVENIDMIVPGTVEEGILYSLRKKINMADLINQDGWRRWVI